MTDILTAPGASAPDIMNDPEYDTNAGDGEDGMADVSQCRICRGEGSDGEPLFHPCKCSGSIKFVHQDCLMEWLSHSQKKHCELCKTPFRFTKLYSPNMPQSLPIPVLCRHVIIHSAKNLVVWMRFLLVATVWLGILPFAIRQIWRLLFWFSDGGWPTVPVMQLEGKKEGISTGMDVLRQFQIANLAENGTCPVSPLQAVPTTPSGISGIVDTIIGLWNPDSQKPTLNVTDALTTGLLKSLAYGLGIDSDSSKSNSAQSLNDLPVVPQRSSLLSEVSLLRNLTRHPSINRLVINITEGYVITFLVVFCFILVFLIREWVVQQQPGINMGAGFNADFAAGPGDRIGEPAVLPNLLDDAGDNDREGQRAAGNRLIARPRRAQNGRRGAIVERVEDVEDVEGVAEYDLAPLNRPAAVRDVPAIEVQRMLTEEPRMTEEFLAIWRRADSDPQEVLRIIERENKSDQMRYWVNAMQLLQKPSLLEEKPPTLPSSSAEDSSEKILSTPESQETTRQEAQPSSISTDLALAQDISESSIDLKGKGKARDDTPSSEGNSTYRPVGSKPGGLLLDLEALERQTLEAERLEAERVERPRREMPTSDFKTRWPGSEVTRPRSQSDGPAIRDTVSPLAHNSWSFANLDDDEEDVDDSSVVAADFSTLSETISVSDANENQEGSTRDSVSPQPFDPQYDPQYDPRPIIVDGPVEIIGLDSVTRVHENWDEVFENNPIGDSDSETEEEQQLVPALVLEATVPRPAEPQGVLGHVAEFLWGGLGDDRHLDEPGPNEEHIVQDLANEAPFVPVAHLALEAQDRDVVEAALAAGIDPNDADGLDAIDDAEDFEGIMELVGMRGPLTSLIQNALFSVFLLALTVAFGVWIPYNIGRVSLLLIANPGPTFKLPLRFIFGCAAFMQDLGLLAIGAVSYLSLALCSLPVKMWSYYTSRSMMFPFVVGGIDIQRVAANILLSAGKRIADGTVHHFTRVTESDLFTFSAASHESLIFLRSLVANTFASIGTFVSYPFVGIYSALLTNITVALLAFFQNGWLIIKGAPTFLARPDSWVISLEVAKRSAPLDPDLSVWGGTDRFWAITAGYTVICILGAMYVGKGMPFLTGQVGREWEANIIDLLNQAGGVLKVILIISIEMLVFPLYCGLLLDAALLPLFDDTTIISRILFTVHSPLTSIFVHWFVGTCYMFHFALFVSMCRKIMRKGVLYFIRDPDDPTFHPVRDVLERNVATQLRKILFSALVYGGLVVVCLGGVVWGLAYVAKGVLPIHWSSNEPVLEFPIDLLFYNFLMPLAVKFFKPSDGLHAMYTWWFRKCARMLRLTWFMFGERKLDEEGYVVHRTWGDFFRGVPGDAENKINPTDDMQPFAEDPELRAYLHQDGRYVRAPASDQVRIPKGSQIFLEVDEKNKRVDKKKDKKDGAHGRKNDHYKHVYIPPWFQFRISIFILSIWLFAAITGVSITIVPLALGRVIFAKIIPPHVRQNDIYAFSIGIYILGSALYAVLNVGTFVSWLRKSVTTVTDTPYHVLRKASSIGSWILRVLWIYTAFLIVLPTLYAFVVEMYFITPLHTYLSMEEQHVINFVQSWTLGLLYVKLTTVFIMWFEGSRPARSIHAITARGYLHPDARLATRSFILPSFLLLGSALFWPWVVAKLAVMTTLKNEPSSHTLAFRYAYPLTLCMAIWALALYVVLGWLKAWRMKIRDEVYLIGERLHNFGDRRVATSGVNVPRMRRLEA